MSKSSAAGKTPAAAYARNDTANPPADLAALMLDVLNNVNRQIKTTPTLDGRTQAAVERFRAISRSLRTLADDAAASIGTASELRRP
jgi:hypothetical protein